MDSKRRDREKARIAEEREMAAYFDRCFDKGLFLSFEPGEKERAERLVQMFQIQRGWRILEPGCGCGRMTRLLAEQAGPEGTIEACELSPKMIDWCRRSGLPSWVNFSNTSVLDLDISPESLDAVICFNVWPHFTQPEVYLDCFGKSLKCGGFLFIAHSSGRETINSIHQDTSGDTIKSLVLPPALDLAALISHRGFQTLDILSQEDIYYLKAVRI